MCAVIHDLLHGIHKSKPYLFQFVELKKTLEAVNLDKIIFLAYIDQKINSLTKRNPPKIRWALYDFSHFVCVY